MSIENSLKYFKEASKYIPSGVNSPVRAFKSVGGSPIFIKRGDGPYLIDVDENRYVDFVQSWGPLIFGYCDNRIQRAIIKAVKEGITYGAPTKAETDLAKEITSLFDSIDQVRFVSSGTEATMGAIRVARGFTKKSDIVKFEGCYHGHSDCLLSMAGSGAATHGKPSSLGVLESFTKHTLLAKYNDIDSLKRCFEQSSDIACVIIEPIAGNMGLIKADREFLLSVRELCTKHKAILIFDEIISFLRASLRGSFDINAINADMITFGKVIGGGMPIGAFGSSKEIMSCLSPNGGVYQAGTLSGNLVAMRAGLATIKAIKQDKDMFDGLQKLSKKLVDGLKRVARDANVSIVVEHVGSMFGFFFNENRVKNFDDALKSDANLFSKFHKEMLGRGFYLGCSQYETGFISTKITEEMIDSFIYEAGRVFKKIS